MSRCIVSDCKGQVEIEVKVEAQVERGPVKAEFKET